MRDNLNKLEVSRNAEHVLLQVTGTDVKVSLEPDFALEIAESITSNADKILISGVVKP